MPDLIDIRALAERIRADHEGTDGGYVDGSEAAAQIVEAFCDEVEANAAGEYPVPRLSEQTRQDVVRAAEHALEAAADLNAHEQARRVSAAVCSVLWRKLVGDTRDRCATALHAARAVAELDDTVPVAEVAARRRRLQKSLDALDHPAAWPPGRRAPARKD